MANIPRLTDIEIMIMKVLWEHEDGLTIQEITSCIEQKKISAASVAQAIKHMSAKQAVKVCDYVQVSNVYARKFSTCFGQEEFLAAEFHRLQKSVFGNNKLHVASITAAFLGSSENEELELDEIDELEKIISQKKKNLKKKEK